VGVETRFDAITVRGAHCLVASSWGGKMTWNLKRLARRGLLDRGINTSSEEK
jgi:hypothetical protein